MEKVQTEVLMKSKHRHDKSTSLTEAVFSFSSKKTREQLVSNNNRQEFKNATTDAASLVLFSDRVEQIILFHN